METLVIVAMGLSILGALVFGVFLVTKRQEDTNRLLKEIAGNSKP